MHLRTLPFLPLKPFDDSFEIPFPLPLPGSRACTFRLALQSTQGGKAQHPLPAVRAEIENRRLFVLLPVLTAPTNQTAACVTKSSFGLVASCSSSLGSGLEVRGDVDVYFPSRLRSSCRRRAVEEDGAVRSAGGNVRGCLQMPRDNMARACTFENRDEEITEPHAYAASNENSSRKENPRR